MHSRLSNLRWLLLPRSVAFALSCAPVVRLLVFLTSATGSSSLRQVAHSMAARVSVLFEAALNGMPDALKSGFRVQAWTTQRCWKDLVEAGVTGSETVVVGTEVATATGVGFTGGLHRAILIYRFVLFYRALSLSRSPCTLGRFESTHVFSSVSHHTPHTTYTTHTHHNSNNTQQHTTTHGDRQRDRERERRGDERRKTREDNTKDKTKDDREDKRQDEGEDKTNHKRREEKRRSRDQ